MIRRVRYDGARVKAAAQGRGVEILQRVAGIPIEKLDGKHHPCPHPSCADRGGTNRFRMIDEKSGAVLCNQCFRSGNGDFLAAIRWMLGCSFSEALALAGAHLGLEPDSTSARKRRMAKGLRFLDWEERCVEQWCMKKPPIMPEAFYEARAEQAVHRERYPVFCFPIWPATSDPERPVGYAMVDQRGERLPAFDQQGKVTGHVKIKNSVGSKPGWIGQVFRLREATTVWKVEGVTDLLALISMNLPKGHVVLTNAMGAGETPRPELIRVLAGKETILVHDADRPGEDGAAKWEQALLTVASRVKRIRLPYEIAEKQGKDLRDFLFERGATAVQELLDLAKEVERMSEPTPPDDSAALFEAVDDPHRLARVLLANDFAGGPVRYWREEWHVWKDGAWSSVSESAFRPQANLAIKAEFDRAHRQQLESGSDEVSHVRKVTMNLVSNVLQAMSGLANVSPTVDWNCSLAEPGSGRRPWAAMENGLMKIDRLIDGRSDALVPHAPDWWSPVRLPYAYEPQATCPRWYAFLDKNLEGDPERIAVLQEWMGYLLIPKTDFAKFLMLEGDGANGKSVICAVAEALVGPGNASHVPLESFGQRFALMPMLGKLLNVCAEIGEIDRVAEAELKKIVAGDPVTVDRKGKEPIEVVPTARLIFATNNRPRFVDRSQGLWRRLILLPLNVTVEPSERVLGMDKADWWLRQGEMPGVFLWALEGLQRLLANGGFSYSREVACAIRDYQRDANPARVFLEEECEFDPTCSMTCQSLYAAYRQWCLDHGYHPLASRTFGREVRAVYPQMIRRRIRSGADGWVYSGAKIVHEEAF